MTVYILFFIFHVIIYGPRVCNLKHLKHIHYIHCFIHVEYGISLLLQILFGCCCYIAYNI